MTWSTVHDETLCREILVVDPFTVTKKGTVARGTRWEEVAENINKIQQIYFKVDKRAVRDRYNLLSKELRNKLKREEKESGIETNMTEVEMALEELIEKEDAAETEQREPEESQGQSRQGKCRECSKEGYAVVSCFCCSCLSIMRKENKSNKLVGYWPS